jgi:hypothetical protein
MFYHKGEPYSLRKYKRIFKNEMEKYPHLYDVLDEDGNPKERIDGIITAVAEKDDDRFNHNIKGEVVLPEDLDAAWKAYKEN